MISIPGLGTIDFGPVGRREQSLAICPYQNGVHVTLQIATTTLAFSADEHGMYGKGHGWRWRFIRDKGMADSEIPESEAVAPSWFLTALRRICETTGANEVSYTYNSRDFPNTIWINLVIPEGWIEHPAKWLEERIAPMLLPPD